MKPRRFFILLVMALCWIALPASASSLGDIRLNARFLTDRMAYELRLTNRQYNDIFEINYDFFYNVDPYIDDMSYGDPYALDMYYRYLDERNDDIRWVLSRKHYVRFMGLEHFFLPVYAVNRVCYVRIYNIYPNRTYFYFGRPSHYYSYHGGHCRHHHGGISFYQTNYRKHYRHSVYNGHYQSVRTRTRGRDFPVVDRRSHRNSVVTDGNRLDVRRNPTEVRGNRLNVRRNPSEIKTDRSEVRRNHSEVRGNESVTRGHSSEVRHRSENVRRQSDNAYTRPARHESRHYESSSTRVNRSRHTEAGSRSTRTSVRQRSSDSGSRSHSSTSSRSERSERRGVRER